MDSCFNDVGRNIGMFYTSDCKCNGCEKAYRLLNKSLRLLMEYRCVPSGSMAADKDTIDLDEIKQIHKELIQEFNEWVDRVEKWDTRQDKGETEYFRLTSVY